MASRVARGRHRVAIRLTSYAASMFVSADQEYSSLMGAHCLCCRTLQTFHHGKTGAHHPLSPVIRLGLQTQRKKENNS